MAKNNDPQPEEKAQKKQRRTHHRGPVLPRGCKLDDVKKLIDRYQCFEFNRCVYVVKSKMAIQVSNFVCSIHMHIVDEHPTRLISILNENFEEEVLHVSHEVFNTLQQFRKTVTGRGCFKWMGTEGDYMLYLWYMMDHMGKGRMILEPGMQPEGFYAFTNAVCNGSVIELDKFGTFQIGPTKYYIPAANLTLADSDTGYGNARKVVFERSEVTFEQLSFQQFRVHGKHSMLALVHSVGTVFSDHIRARLDGFPIPCYYGPPGTGKDQVVKSSARIHGKPQPSLRLPAMNTGPAIVNLFAELRCVPLYCTEWESKLPPMVHTFVMGLWDGEGRRRGEKVQAGRSRFSTEDVPIRCTASLSCNEYPNFMDQLLDRLVVSEMDKLKLDMDKREQYRILNDMSEQGYSYLMADVVKHREEFIRDWFRVHYQRASEMVNMALGSNFISERMRKNICILLSIHLFFADKLRWAFTPDMFCQYLVESMVKQQSRRLSGDDVSNFWTCFVAGVNTKMIERDKHFELREALKTIAFYWTDIFPVYMENHRRMFGTPGKRDILNKLKQHDCFVAGKNKDVHEGYVIGTRKSSAYVFDVQQVGTDLLGLLDVKKHVPDQFPI